MDDILSPLTDLELWRSDPFKLKDKIKKFYVKGKEIIDLSRGDPIDPPGLNADQVFNYFQHLSILIQEEILERHEQVYSENIEKYIKHKSDIDFHWIEKKFKSVPTSSNIYNNVIYAVDDIEKKNGKTQKDLLIEILKCNRSSGYGDISGEDTVRQILAAYLNETSSSIGGGEINKNNLILTLGGSECISVIFKVLNSINFIREKSLINLITPIYGPYNELIREYNLVGKKPLELCQSDYYRLTKNSIDKWYNSLDKNSFYPIFVLVNPSNPTGAFYDKDSLKYLADKIKELNKKQKVIVIEDIVYYEFMFALKPDTKFNSISEFLPDQTLIVGSMSKTFRATGNRLGYLLISNAAAQMLDNQFRIEICQFSDSQTFIDLFKILKAPDKCGAFSHTHLVPRISQWLGAFRLIFHLKDNESYFKHIKERWNVFNDIMGLNSNKDSVPYYLLVDFLSLIKNEATKNNIPVRENPDHTITINNKVIHASGFITELAKNGVIGLPAARFFIGNEVNNLWKVRFSISNSDIQQVTEAANIINSCISDLCEG